jgi:hypothetical protein
MPMFGDNILPDTLGRSLGSNDLPWDIVARNITFLGTMNGGTGQQNLAIANSVQGGDSLSVQSDVGDGNMLTRFHITNPGNTTPQMEFKNGIVVFGGVNAADSLGTPIRNYCGPNEVGPRQRWYRRGDNANAVLDIDMLGQILSYVNYAGTPASWAFALQRLGEANPLFAVVAADAGLGWGAGGGTALDVGLTRTSAGYLSIDNRAGGYGNLNLNFAHFFAAQGAAPFQVDSTTRVNNLNADLLDGSDWSNPPAIGSVTPPAITAASLQVQGQIGSQVQTGTPPMIISSATPVPNLNVQQVTDVTFNNTVFFDGSGCKHARVAIPAIAASGQTIFRVTWNTAFPDATYTVVATLFDSALIGGSQAVAGLELMRKTGQTAAFCEFYIRNNDAANAHSGVLHVIAMRG